MRNANAARRPLLEALKKCSDQGYNDASIELLPFTYPYNEAVRSLRDADDALKEFFAVYQE